MTNRFTPDLQGSSRQRSLGLALIMGLGFLANSTLSRGAPIPISDHYATFQGVTLQVEAPGLIANDLHPQGKSFILSNFFPPTHGTLTSIVTSGAFTYVPPEGFTGTDEFRYLLRDEDGNFSDAITVTIEVVPDPNRPPVGVPDFFGTLIEYVELEFLGPLQQLRSGEKWNGAAFTRLDHLFVCALVSSAYFKWCNCVIFSCWRLV